MDTITYKDFSKLDIRIGKILSAEKVPDTDKLLKLIVDLGVEKRQIISGIAEYFPDLEVLEGKEVPILVNLAPRTIKGLESQGMLLAIESGGKAILMSPWEDVSPGSPVK